MQRDKSSCVPGTTSPRSTLFPASSLFLAFFFAPTFWLSFLPSQVFFIWRSKGRALSTKTCMDMCAYVNLTFFSLSLSLSIYPSIHLSIYRCKFHRGLVLKHLKTSFFFIFFSFLKFIWKSVFFRPSFWIHFHFCFFWLVIGVCDPQWKKWNIFGPCWASLGLLRLSLAVTGWGSCLAWPKCSNCWRKCSKA